ncbi:MAG: alpha-galactosidase [Thermotogaceae bacterium]|jgi:alpha-galactosidase|nr:alpha-galactosidase [Thermotogaceae bacterium]
MPKIAIIGAGSVVFTKNLVTDILMFPELQNSEIHLMDIDEDRLNTAFGLISKIAEGLKVKPTIRKTLNRREALKDADYVINTIQVGGFEATLIDFDIPEKYGLKQTIADTHGIGGIFRALRTIPVLLEMASDMEELCPKALMINYSNPMAMNVWAVYKISNIKVVGLCHSIQGTARQIASYIGVPYEKLRYKAAGINHMCWFLELEVDKKDAYPLLREARKNPEIFKKDPVRFSMMDLFGYFVSESSEHMAEYVPYFIPYEEKIKELNIPIREYVRRCIEGDKEYQRNKRIALGQEPIGELKKSHEYASGIIHSMETGYRRCIHGNVENTGLITNLPNGACVEVPCMVDKNGIQPTYVGELPPQLAGLNRTQINVQDLTVRAVLERRKEYVYYAALLDPLAKAVMKPEKIIEMVDELFEAHKKYLGYFE